MTEKILVEHNPAGEAGETPHPIQPKRRMRGEPKINLVDREVDNVRTTMHWVTQEKPKPLTLTGAGEILLGIAQILSDLNGLMRTHEALQSAGEPLAELLERRLQSLADELKMRLAHPESVFLGDLAEGLFTTETQGTQSIRENC